MSVQIGYKKQVSFFLILIILLLIIIETISNVWLSTQIHCEFENNEIFKEMDMISKKKMCNELYSLRTTGADLVPNQKFDSININNFGFRGPEISIEKPADTYRIFMVGGSTMFGMGASNDKTTIPGYVQTFINDLNLEKNVEVINAGIQKANTITELSLVRDKITKFDPDLIIMYDGWNDLRENIDPKITINNWNSVCELGQQNNFKTIVIQQPIAGFSNKALTETEYFHSKNGVDYNNNPLIDKTKYYDYISGHLSSLKSCAVSLNMRNVFDEYVETIYWDQGHTSDKGNFIVAKSIFEQIVSIIDISKSSNTKKPIYDNTYRDNFENIFKNFISYYKTPIMINSLMSKIEYDEPTSQISNIITLESQEQQYLNDNIFISMKIIPSGHSSNYKIQLQTINKEQNQPIKNVTYFLTIKQNDEDILREHLFSHDEILEFAVYPYELDSFELSGYRNYEFNALNDDFDNKQPIVISGPLLYEDANYTFLMDIRTLHDPQNWIFTLEDFEINYKANNSQIHHIVSNYDAINPFVYTNNEKKIFDKIQIDSQEYVQISEISEDSKKLKNLAFEWKNKNISDEQFIEFLKKQNINYTISKENMNFDLPDWLKNNAGVLSKEILTDTMSPLSNYGYIEEKIHPCSINSKGTLDNRCWTIKLNSMGLRSEEIESPKPHDTFRIITLGGSTTFSGETNQNTWPGHLQRLIDENLSDKNIEIINAGKQGATTKFELNLLQKHLLKLEPDLVVMYDGWNDSATTPISETIQNWTTVCELGNKNNFSTYIIIQPLPTFGYRILTDQEIASVLTPEFSSPNNYDEISSKYLESLSEANKTCSKIIDLRYVFDYIHAPIYYDGGHVLNNGSIIIAKNIFTYVANDFFEKNFSIKELEPEYSTVSNHNHLYAVGSNFNKRIFSNLIINYGIFDKTNLSDANFSNSNLENSRFVFANLANANLANANLANANLANANLANANLANANLANANLANANLANANLANANLANANLANANLEKALINFKWIYCWNISEILQEMPEHPLDETIKQLLKSDCHKI